MEPSVEENAAVLLLRRLVAAGCAGEPSALELAADCTSEPAAELAVAATGVTRRLLGVGVNPVMA